jgi:drug/metabolite transporter (DMT)-like permease
MHKSFLPLFLVSLVGVLGSSFIDHENSQYQVIGLIAGVLPLLGYYYALARKKLLSPSEIDSVYYFGFLVTVITLVSTAVAIGIATKLPELKWILLQFGLGLIATGIALFARLMLMTKSTSEVELDVVESSKLLVLLSTIKELK